MTLKGVAFRSTLPGGKTDCKYMGGSRQRTLWCSRKYLNCEANNISSYGMRDKEKGKPENLSSHQCARVQGRCICELLARGRQEENSDSTPKAN